MYQWIVGHIDKALLHASRCTPIARELDNPVDDLNERHGAPAVVRGPAHFADMSDAQLRDWPKRDAIHWIAGKIPVVLAIVVGALALGFSLCLPLPPVLSITGLVLDILGVWWLAGNILVSDPEANRASSVGAFEKTDLTVRRDRNRAHFSLGVITLGFSAQALSPLLALADAVTSAHG